METSTAKRLLIGFILIGIGGMFLAAQLGFITLDPSELISTYWPVILILFGFFGLIGQCKQRRDWGGSALWNILVIIFGIGFLLKNMELIDLSMGDFIRMLIPVFIILFGLRMMFKPANTKPPQDYSYKYENKYEYNPHQQPVSGAASFSSEASPPPPSMNSGSFTPPPNGRPRSEGEAENRSGFFGDLYLGHDDWELKPMNVSHFIGDTVIDLTKAQIPIGETRLNISAFIGDVKVFVPNHIDVEISVSSSSFLGDITVFNRREGGFLRSVHEEASEFQIAEKRIRLQVSLFIGDINVQRVG